MKRKGLTFLMFLGMALAVTGAQAAERSEAAPASVALLDQELELVLLTQNDIVSGAESCLACVALAGSCNSGSGKVCNRSQGCTCQWCGGRLICRPGSIFPFPFPRPRPNL